MIKQNWWKILGVLLFIYVLIVGMCVPLGTGIQKVNNVETGQEIYNLKGGEMYQLRIQSYNTKYTTSEPRVWIKLDSVYSYAITDVKVIDNNNLELNLQLPTNLPSEKKQSATLIIDELSNGYAILPDAFMISNANELSKSGKAWSKKGITSYHTVEPFAFPYRSILNETIRNTFFHVALWFAMFILLVVSLVQSIQYLMTKDIKYDHFASSYTSVAILFGLLGLVTGSIWAKYTWGTFWTTDVKLNMSAIAMLIYLAYWLLRSSIKDIDSKARISAAYNIFAFLALIPLIFVIPRMTDSLHPGNGGNPALGGEDLDNTLRMVFYPSIIALTLIGCWIASLQARMNVLVERIYTKK